MRLTPDVVVTNFDESVQKQSKEYLDQSKEDEVLQAQTPEKLRRIRPKTSQYNRDD